MIDTLKKIMQVTDPDDLSCSVFANLQKFPLHLHCKNKKGEYIDFNERVLIDAGFCNSADLKNLTDLDFTFLKNGEAQKIQDRDKEVFKKNISTLSIGSFTLYNKKQALDISIKNPITSKFSKKIIGVMTCAFVLEEGSSLYENQLHINRPIKFQDSIDKKLSMREKQCLELYLSGSSTNETAVILGLSHRTIEDYINNIKKKFHCRRKRDLLKLLGI